MSDKTEDPPATDKAGPGDWLPQCHFGTAATPLPAATRDTEEDPDDEELPETPEDVIAMLGFDPLDEADDDQEDQTP